VRIRRSSLAALTLCSFVAPSSAATFLTVFGGPAYDQTSHSGYLGPATLSVGNGVAVCSAQRVNPGGYLDTRALRWDASGVMAAELGNLGTASVGATTCFPFGINSAGTAVGLVYKYSGGTNVGVAAVRWDASGTAAVELGNLGNSFTGYFESGANSINAAGTVVGYSTTYESNGLYRGARAVRWGASGTAAIELGNLGTYLGSADASAYAVNGAGTAVGYASKIVNLTVLGARAVRWDASGTAATELGNLGTDGTGSATSYAYAVNGAGTAVGYAEKYVYGMNRGERAVRWNGSGTAATELGNLGTDSGGSTGSHSLSTGSRANAVNGAGIAVGYAEKYTDNGADLGRRAVRWDASSAAVTELGNLGTDGNGDTASYAS
jgi:hypothetical protein